MEIAAAAAAVAANPAAVRYKRRARRDSERRTGAFCGDADEVVPYPENTVKLFENYRRLGGQTELILKPGFKHHPHGLDDPKPAVDWILKQVAKP